MLSVQGWIQDFLRRGLNIEVISEAGGCSSPEATGCVINITQIMPNANI